MCSGGAQGEDCESRAWIEPWAHSAGCTWNLVVMLVMEGNGCEKEAFGIHSHALQGRILTSVLQMLWSSFSDYKEAKLLLDLCWLSWHNFKHDFAAFLHLVA